jgi:hypothetical protein
MTGFHPAAPILPISALCLNFIFPDLISSVKLSTITFPIIPEGIPVLGVTSEISIPCSLYCLVWSYYKPGCCNCKVRFNNMLKFS